MDESFPEKTRTMIAARFRWGAGLAMERLHINPSGRYERHRAELRRHLKTIPTRYSEHHLLQRFISDIPTSLARPSVEKNEVRALDTLTLKPNDHGDNVQLITLALCGEEFDSETITKKAYEAPQQMTDKTGSVYRYVAGRGEVCARIEEEGIDGNLATRVKELIMPTIIPGIVIGFSGLGVSKLNNVQGSALHITFYSVPPKSV
jgi:hypothetical protein